MDPIIAAIAAGAAAGLSATASQVVRDAYAALKARLSARYPGIDVEPLERRPTSPADQASLARQLSGVGAVQDHELLRLALAVVLAVEREAPQTAAGVGVDLEDVRAKFVEIVGVSAPLTGVRVRRTETDEGVTISNVQVGGGQGPNR